MMKSGHMAAQKLSNGAVNFLRRTAVILGCVFILISILADPLGLSVGQGLSRNQVAFGMAGLVFIAAGILGRRFPGVYRGTGVLILNLLVVVVAVEFLSLVIVKIIDADRFRDRSRKMTEGHADILDGTAVQGMYAPYVVWRTNPLVSSEILTISQEGYRQVPGVFPDHDAYTVFLFGGSTMWGYGVPDSCTIGAYLANMVFPTGGGVNVRNLAQPGFASTQEVIELMMQLQQGNVPDLVVFLDGVNDIWNAYVSGQVGGHAGQELVASRVEGRSEEFQPSSIWDALLKESNLSLLITSLRPDEDHVATEDMITYTTMGLNRDSLTRSIVDTYLGNCRIVQALGAEYGFECLFAWQPCIWVGDRALTTEEQTLAEGGIEGTFDSSDSTYIQFIASSYSTYGSSIPDTVHYISLAGVFDNCPETVYSDRTGVHLTSLGNRMVAEAILEAIQQEVPVTE